MITLQTRNSVGRIAKREVNQLQTGHFSELWIYGIVRQTSPCFWLLVFLPFCQRQKIRSRERVYPYDIIIIIRNFAVTATHVKY